MSNPGQRRDGGGVGVLGCQGGGDDVLAYTSGSMQLRSFFQRPFNLVVISHSNCVSQGWWSVTVKKNKRYIQMDASPPWSRERVNKDIGASKRLQEKLHISEWNMVKTAQSTSMLEIQGGTSGFQGLMIYIVLLFIAKCFNDCIKTLDYWSIVSAACWNSWFSL